MIVDFINGLCKFDELFEGMIWAECFLDGFLSLLNLITLFYLKIVELQMAAYHHVVEIYWFLPF